MNSETRALLEDAAVRYLDATPWASLRDYNFFQVVDQETGLDGWVSVAGNMGEEHGLGIYLGRDARKTLEKVLALDLDVDAQTRASDVIALTVVDAQEAVNFKEGNKLDRKIEVAGKPVCPIVFRKPPGERTLTLKDKEATFLARVLIGVAKTKEWGLGEDDVEDEVGGRLILKLSGPTSNLAIDRAYDVPPPPLAVVLPALLEQRLHEARRTKRLLVRYAGKRLVVLDPKEKAPYFDETLETDDSALAAQTLLEVLGEPPGLVPREIWTDTPSLEQLLAPVLAPLGVKVVVKLELKELRRAFGG